MNLIHPFCFCFPNLLKLMNIEVLIFLYPRLYRFIHQHHREG